MRDDGQMWLSSGNPDKAHHPNKQCSADLCLLIGKVVHRQSTWNLKNECYTHAGNDVIQLNQTIGLLLVLAVVVIKVIVDIAWYIIEYLLGKR